MSGVEVRSSKIMIKNKNIFKTCHKSKSKIYCGKHYTKHIAGQSYTPNGIFRVLAGMCRDSHFCANTGEVEDSQVQGFREIPPPSRELNCVNSGTAWDRGTPDVWFSTTRAKT